MRRMTRLARCAGAALLVLMAVATPARLGAAPGASEYELKAAFLFNFAKFIDWPPNALENATGVSVCVLGDDPFGDLLDRTLAGKSVHERPLVVRRHDTLGDTGGCHILFVSAAEERRLARVAPPEAPVLTVGETDGFVQRGGIIAFAMDDKRLRFEINADAADRAGLRISSQLLKLATRVVHDGS